VKLDVQVFSVERQKDGFMVAVNFVNSGKLPIKMFTPDNWKRQWGDAFSVEAASLDGKKKWSVDLLGLPLLNRSEFPDETIEILAGNRATFKFLIVPSVMVYRGAYRMNALVFTGITGEGDVATMGKVNFRSNPSKATQITIERDYPSTPQEREQWEAQHRASMSLQPVKPGETFVEDGLYRAVRLISGAGYRSLQVKPFKAGDIATAENVRMPMESANGVEINGPVQWVWEASAPTRTKPFSSDYIEGTEHVCKPGAPCPRNGRWIERTEPDSWAGNYTYRFSSLITRRAGQQMPQIQGDPGKTEWEWVGA
jgi:hypothetical protein